MERASRTAQPQKVDDYKNIISNLLANDVPLANDFVKYVLSPEERRKLDPEFDNELVDYIRNELDIQSRTVSLVPQRIIPTGIIGTFKESARGVVRWNRSRQIWLALHIFFYLVTCILFGFTKVFHELWKKLHKHVNASTLVYCYIGAAAAVLLASWVAGVNLVHHYRSLTSASRRTLMYHGFWTFFSISPPMVFVIYGDQFAGFTDPLTSLFMTASLCLCIIAAMEARILKDDFGVNETVRAAILTNLAQVDDKLWKAWLAGLLGSLKPLFVPIILLLFRRITQIACGTDNANAHNGRDENPGREGGTENANAHNERNENSAREGGTENERDESSGPSGGTDARELIVPVSDSGDHQSAEIEMVPQTRPRDWELPSSSSRAE